MIAALLLGCAGGGKSADILNVSAEVSADVVTVVTVSWTTSEPTRGQVIYRGAGGEQETPLESQAGTTHSVPLLGLTADTDVEYQVVLEDGSSSDSQSVHTGTLPGELPSTTVSGDGHDDFIVTPLLGNSAGPIILDPEGRVVWYALPDSDLDTYRVRLARDGSGVYYNLASVSGDPSDDSVLVESSWTGEELRRVAIPRLAHDFVELEDGTIAAMVVEFRTDDAGQDVRGDSLVEIAPDDTVTTVWDTWDCFDPTEQPGDDPVLGWTFANALDYDAEGDGYWLNLRNFSSIVHIDRATGACDEVVGSEAATVTLDGDAFHHEHQFDRVGDDLLVFDNDGAGDRTSRVIEYSVDAAAGVAREIWSYSADPSVYSFVLGDVHRYDDGDTFVDWSVAGQMDRVDADGKLLWRMNTDLGTAFGFLELHPSLTE